MHLSRHSMLLLAFCCTAVGAAAAEDMTDCIAGMKANEAGQYMRSAKLTSRCIANGELTDATMARAWRILGIALRSAGQAEKAVEALEIAISMKPQDVWMDQVNLANAYSDLGQYENALKSLAIAEISATDLGEVHYNRGIVLERLGRVDEAKSSYLKAFESGLRSKKLADRIIALDLYGKVHESW